MEPNKNLMQEGERTTETSSSSSSGISSLEALRTDKSNLSSSSSVSHFTPPKETISSIEELVKVNEIHDFLHKFHLTARKHADLCCIPRVNYAHEGGEVSSGSTICKINVPQVAPHVTWDAKNFKEPFAVLMVDPDAPNGEYLHYAVINAKRMDSHSGHTALPFVPPCPPSGVHRYFTVILKSDKRLDDDAILVAHRQKFDIVKFCTDHSFYLIGLHYFKVTA